MSAKIYELISNIAFISAGIMLVLSVVLFIKFKIPKVYADISGVAAKREIKGINEKNAQEHGKSRKLSPFTYQRGKTSEMVPPAEGMVPITVSRNNIKESEPAIQTTIYETEVLDARNYPQPDPVPLQSNQSEVSDFVVEDDIVYIHTDEIIL